MDTNHVIPPGRVMVDVEGVKLNESERKRLQHPNVGGVILFARNYSTRDELITLCREIHEARSEPLLITVDQEGGRVQRFRTEGFTVLPSMRSIGAFWNKDQIAAMRLATDIGFVMAAELRACGVDFSFAPVLDIDFKHNFVIGERAFHIDPKVVAKLARCVAQGMALVGMRCCGKHFPGHGYVEVDSHIGQPIDDRDLNTILSVDVDPYISLGNTVLSSIIPGHVIYPKVDKYPAGFSKKWLQQILRKKLGFKGVIFSDDLAMKAASWAGGIVERANAALKAGCDMVLICNRPDLADEALKGLRSTDNEAAVARIRQLTPPFVARGWDELQEYDVYLESRDAIMKFLEV